MTELTLPAPDMQTHSAAGPPSFQRIFLDTNLMLRQKCLPVETFDRRVYDIACAMLVTCMDEGGIGLAANQVGIPLRIVVVGAPWRRTVKGVVAYRTPAPYVFVNPVVRFRGKRVDSEEGCLSSPGKKFRVRRYNRVDVSYQDLDGDPQRCTASGLIARVFQHEADHLDGILPRDREIE